MQAINYMKNQINNLPSTSDLDPNSLITNIKKKI